MTNIYQVTITSSAIVGTTRFTIEASRPGTAINRALQGEPANRANRITATCQLLRRNMTMPEYKALRAAVEAAEP